MFGLGLRAKPHDALDAGAIVPTAVENHDFPGRRQVRQVSLDVHLRFFTLGGCGQRHHAEDPRTDAGGDGFNGAAFASTVPPLKDDANLQTLVPYPFLQLDELHVQLSQDLFVLLAFEIPGACFAAFVATIFWLADGIAIAVALVSEGPLADFAISSKFRV